MSTAEELIHNARALLLDFDGPMAALMPPPLNAEAAERVRKACGAPLPTELMTTTDHLAIVRHLIDQPDALARAEAAATAAEVDCARICEPAPWLEALLADVEARGIPWAVVTNNSPGAAVAFLDRFDFPAPAAICGRTAGNVRHMKPKPGFVLEAVRTLDVESPSATFVGDSVSDVEAGKDARVVVVGYSDSSAKTEALLAVGASAVMPSTPSR